MVYYLLDNTNYSPPASEMTMIQRVDPFKLELRTDSKRWLATATVAGVLLLAGCGGEGDAPGTVGIQPVVQNDTAAARTPEGPRTPAGFNVHKAVKLADGLIPELTGIPLPEGPVVFEVGVAHSADIDPRETAIQTVHFTISPQELLGFYLTTLPSAGFKVKSSLDAFAEASRAIIEFTDANGIPGRLFFRPGAWSESQMNINLFRSGTAD